MEITFIFGLVVLLIVVGFWLTVRSRKRIHNQPKSASVIKKSNFSEIEKTDSEVPDCILIGRDPESPAIIIQPVSEDKVLVNSKILDIKSDKAINRLSAMLQAIPSVLVAVEASGKNLMEVVIKGDLVKAADGIGYRGFSRVNNKISEHARLFKVDKLKTMINFAALLQVASVIVAQKYLADISKKLSEIQAGIEHISLFLENQRKARILAAYEYIREVYLSIKNGEISNPSVISSSHIELERRNGDLSEILYHLEMEFRQKVEKKVEHTEFFGTEQLTNDIGKKISYIEGISSDIALCLKTKLADWHVSSLLTGNEYKPRQEDIIKSIQSFSDLASYFESQIASEVNSIDSLVTSDDTLSKRRESLRSKYINVFNSMKTMANENLEYLIKSKELLLKNDQPIHVYLEYENGRLIGARQKE